MGVCVVVSNRIQKCLEVFFELFLFFFVCCSYCDGVSFMCEVCGKVGVLEVFFTEGSVGFIIVYVEDISELFLYDFYCSKLLDLVFLLDGFFKLFEVEFEVLKVFVVGMMERLYIFQKRIRVVVVEYYDGFYVYIEFRDRKRFSELRRIVSQVKYAGSEVVFIIEVLKYTLY